jgi:hypothetical protein
VLDGTIALSIGEPRNFSVDLRTENWFDLSHTHFDWPGHGRRGARHRRQHLAALFTAFRRAIEQTRTAERPLQVWVSIAPDNEPEQDALYVHSPNPNGTQFPYAFRGVQWNANAPPFLRDFVADPSWDLGRLDADGQIWYVVREKLAAPLE